MIRTYWYFSFVILFLFIACKASKLNSSESFVNKKFVAVHSLDMDDFMRLDTILLTSNYKKLNAKFSIHFQGNIVRFNEKVESSTAMETNEKGVDGTSRYYENKTYYGEFTFMDESNQLNIFNLHTYVGNNEDDTVQLLTEPNSDTLVYSIITPTSDTISLIRLK